MDNSLQTLEGELEQLLNLFRDFNELVHAQQPMIDQFEEKVLAAEEQTKSAVTELATVHLYFNVPFSRVRLVISTLTTTPLIPSRYRARATAPTVFRSWVRLSACLSADL
jgi:hypothetical protein